MIIITMVIVTIIAIIIMAFTGIIPGHPAAIGIIITTHIIPAM